jgi:hypothetical protein
MSDTFSLKNRAIYEITWKNILEPIRPQMTILSLRIGCWIPKATDTYPEYLPLIAFPLRQWLHERITMLRYTCTACLVDNCHSILNRAENLIAAAVLDHTCPCTY